MASSTKTENYQLNQYGANDQPTWVGDYSGDMLKIDTALGNAAKRTGDKFNETETYAVGNLCIKDDLLYKFTAAKEAGAWDETKVKATTIEAEFEQLNGDITTHKSSGDHDSRYALKDHNHDSVYSKTNHSHAWSAITGKPSSFTPASHTHDDRYYTESETNTKLNTKLDKSLIKKGTITTSTPNWVNPKLQTGDRILLSAYVLSLIHI